MKKELDFLIIFENKARELEYCCLLQCELRRRGFTTEIAGKTMVERYNNIKYDTDVVITSNAYNNSINNANIPRCVKFKKLIVMQTEQICTEAGHGNANKTDYYKIESVAKDAIYISWGPLNRKWLLDNGICSEDRIRMIGNITYDFCRPEFLRYYNTKKQIAKEYKLNESVKWNLFISSFSPTSLTKTQIDQFNCEMKIDYEPMADVCVKTLKELSFWFESVVCKDPDNIFIYRPHPVEIPILQDIRQLEDKYHNFYIIEGDTVRQWSMVCDRVYTWASTSIIELYFMKKSCAILRPYEIPKNFDIPIYKNCQCIKTYEEFEKTYKDAQEKDEFPLDEECINRHLILDSRLVYLKLADVCVEVRSSEKHIINLLNMEELENYRNNKYYHNGLLNDIYTLLKGCDLIFKPYMFLTNLLSKKKRDNRKYNQNHYGVRDFEVNSIMRRLDAIIANDSEHL